MASIEVIISRTIEAPLISIDGFNRLWFEGSFHPVHEYRPRPTVAPRLVALINGEYVEIAPISIEEHLAQGTANESEHIILGLWSRSQRVEEQLVQKEADFNRLNMLYSEDVGSLKKDLLTASSNLSSFDSTMNENQELQSQLAESRKTIGNLESEIAALKEENRKLKRPSKSPRPQLTPTPALLPPGIPESGNNEQGTLSPTSQSPSASSPGTKPRPTASRDSSSTPASSTANEQDTGTAPSPTSTSPTVAVVDKAAPLLPPKSNCPPAIVFGPLAKATSSPRVIPTTNDSPMKALKLVVLGDACALKTKLCVLMSLHFAAPGAYMPTVFENHNSFVRHQGDFYNVSLWDTVGQEEYDRLRRLCYPQTDIFILGFRLYDPATFTNVYSLWLPELEQIIPDVPIILWATWNDEDKASGNPAVPQDDLLRLMECKPNLRALHIMHENDSAGAYQIMTAAIEKAIVSWKFSKVKKYVPPKAEKKDKDKKSKKK